MSDINYDRSCNSAETKIFQINGYQLSLPDKYWVISTVTGDVFNALSANPTKWSKTLKQFVG